MKVEIVDEAITHLLWVSKAGWQQKRATYEKLQEINPKFQIILADSGTLAVLSV